MLNGKGKARTQRKSLSLKKSKDKKDSTSGNPNSSGVNISKFFMKINETDSDQGLEPRAKKQKKENSPKNNEPFGVQDASIDIDSDIEKDSLNGDILFLNTNEVLLIPATSDTQSFCYPKKITLKKLSSSTIPPNSKIDLHPKIIKKDFQIERSPAMLNSLMSDDDMVIPPTPPIASTFGNKQFCKRSKRSEIKSDSMQQSSSYFSSVQPKKFSLSLKTRLKQNNKVIIATPKLDAYSKVCTSMNQGMSTLGIILDDRILDKEDPTALDMDSSKNKSEESTDSNAVKRFPLRNTKKVYKLSRKTKVQAELSEKSMLSKKLGVPSSKNNNSMLDAEIEDDLLLSYGVSSLQTNGEKDLLEIDPPIVSDCNVESEREPDLAQGHLRGRSLKQFAISPLAKRLSRPTDAECTRVQTNNANFDNTTVDKARLISMAEDVPLLETPVTSPSPQDTVSKTDASACRSRDHMLDISMESLNNEELHACDFMQGIVWSPSPKKTATKNESLVKLHEKHYMKITDAATKDTIADSDSDEEGYDGWYMCPDSVTEVTSVDSGLAVQLKKEVGEECFITKNTTKITNVDSQLAAQLTNEECEERYITKPGTKITHSDLAVQPTKEECDCEECYTTKSAREVACMDSDLSLQANEECEGCHWCSAKSGTEYTSLNVQAKEYEESIKQQGYQRFLVLEVCQREITDDVTCRARGVEKVLRLFDLSINSEQYCQLRDDWARTEVEHGDIVNIVGEPISADSPYILDNQTERYIIVHPDILVSPTSISSSTRCLRRSILEKHFRTEGQVEVMFLGILLHSIFDSALIAKDFSKKFVVDETKKLLQNLPNLVELYGLGINEQEISSKVEAQGNCMAEWSEKYFHKEPHSVHGLIDFKDGGASPKMTSENVALCVSEVVDIEECVWSPKFGLKGKMDVTVEVKINKNPNITKKNRASYETAVLPLELKTGKLSSKLGSVEHRAQVILYSMLMTDRYPSTMDTSLLLYLKAGHMLGVPAYYHEKRALVMKRNEMTRYLSCSYMETAVQNMPAMLQDQRTCKYCSQAKVCTLYHKSVEKGDGESARMGELFDNLTNHLSADHLEYFAHWNMLISLESKQMKKSSHDSDIWCLSGSEREELGYCFSKMVLVSCEASTNPDESGRFVNKFSKQEPRTSPASFSHMRMSKGDYVVVSQDNGLTALATGFLTNVSEEFVSILLDKNLKTCYHHINSIEGKALYRVDKAELSAGAVIQWSNLAKLFFADREQDAKLRRLVVDLEAPAFSSSESLPSQKSEVRNILNDLNTDQKMAIAKVLSAQDYALVLGTPGTGKTTTTACLVRVLRTHGKSILLTSYTHSAVDTILLKLKQSNVDFLRLGSVQKIHPDIQPYALSNAAKHVQTVEELKECLDSKMIVATTCLGSNHAIFSQRSFDYCIVDEASQITQPVCFGPLRHASIFVLVGDHYQLPPLVLSPEAKEAGMDISLFRRLSETHPQAVVNLEHQYRMNKDIMLLSNSLIYQHRLQCGTEEIANSTLALPNWDSFKEVITKMQVQQQVCCSWLLDVLDSRRPVLFLGTDELPAPEVHTDCNISNKIEAGFVTSIVHALIKAGLDANSIGVISPYRHQLEVIKQHLDVGTGNVCSEVEINTVDKYQGRDKLCIVVSLVRSNDGGHVGDLLRDWRRVNVALTRAKQKLILLGSKKTLKSNMLFHEMLLLMEKKSWIYDLPNDAWQGKLF